MWPLTLFYAFTVPWELKYNDLVEKMIWNGNKA